MVLIGAIISRTLINMVRQGIVLGTILEKMRPGNEPDQEDIEMLWF